MSIKNIHNRKDAEFYFTTCAKNFKNSIKKTTFGTKPNRYKAILEAIEQFSKIEELNEYVTQTNLGNKFNIIDLYICVLNARHDLHI